MENIEFQENKLGKECWESRGLEIKNFLSSGAFGSVYYACFKKNCEYVVKIFNTSDEEIQRSILFSEKGIGPLVVDHFTCKEVNFLVIEKLDQTLSDLLLYEGPLINEAIQQQIVDKFNQMIDLGYYFNDFHPGNIMLDKNQNIKYIDFGNMLQGNDFEYLTLQVLKLNLQKWYRRLKFYKRNFN